MSRKSRRVFLQSTGLGLAGAAASAYAAVPGRRAAGANERLVVGLIGPGGMGTGHLRDFADAVTLDVAGGAEELTDAAKD